MTGFHQLGAQRLSIVQGCRVSTLPVFNNGPRANGSTPSSEIQGVGNGPTKSPSETKNNSNRQRGAKKLMWSDGRRVPVVKGKNICLVYYEERVNPISFIQSLLGDENVSTLKQQLQGHMLLVSTYKKSIH